MSLASSPVSAPSQHPPRRLEADTSRGARECAGLVILSPKNPPPNLTKPAGSPSPLRWFLMPHLAGLPGWRWPSQARPSPFGALHCPLYSQMDTLGHSPRPGGDMKRSEACRGCSVREDNRGVSHFTAWRPAAPRTLGRIAGQSAGPALGHPLAAVPEQLLLEKCPDSQLTPPKLYL